MDKLEKLKSLLSVVNDGLSKAEFLEAFKKVTEYVSRIQKQVNDLILKKEFDKLVEEFKSAIIKAKEDNNISIKESEKKYKEAINDIIKEKKIDIKLNEFSNRLEEKSNEIDYKLSNIKDGKDADEGKIIENILKTLRAENEELVIDDIKEIKEELNKLKEENKLNISKRVRGLFGGGFSKIAMESKFIDDETPSGLKNGVNQSFTLANMPNPPSSVKVYVNGSRMRITEDYTLSGRTISFVTAPPTGSIILIDYRQ